MSESVPHAREQLLAERLVDNLRSLVEGSGRSLTVMEVCGTHTMAIHRHGMRYVLPAEINLVSGPGCPVCVTTTGYIDAAIELAFRDDVTLTTFGDMIKVPGSAGSLAHARAEGADVRVVYSAIDAVDLAGKNPEREVVFLGVGFETTSPTVAAAALSAHEEGLKNFSVLAGFKLVPPALRALLDDPGNRLDAFLLPGHVSVILGVEAYRFIEQDYGIAAAVAGFEPVDILRALADITRALIHGGPRLVNSYPQAVTKEGNPAARSVLEKFFVTDNADWRGFGIIPESGYAIREEFAHLDAARKFSIEILPGREEPGCRCGEVLQGKIEPPHCGLYGNRCTPRDPIGPCMVSSEGTCAAWHRYGAL
jgi:hydrogenase expression/formation protein HypD